MDKTRVRKIVRRAYGKIAAGRKGGGCGDGAGQDPSRFAKSIGYTARELKAAPAGSNLALSCGNPTALAALKKGETVLDLGSGAGFDCFIAARAVGPRGRVIGVDMTPEMIEKARENAKKGRVRNVEFRLGEIENLPAGDATVDAVISNCVINLSPDKGRVFREVRRVLKRGGRVAISDLALTRRPPAALLKSIGAYVGCVAGAMRIEEYKKAVEKAGLKKVKVTVKGWSACMAPDTLDPIGRALIKKLGGMKAVEGLVASVYVEGVKA